MGRRINSFPFCTAVLAVPLLALLSACAGTEPYDPLEEYEELVPATTVRPPAADAGQAEALAARGQYLVQLLGCSTCHTDGSPMSAPSV